MRYLVKLESSTGDVQVVDVHDAECASDAEKEALRQCPTGRVIDICRHVGFGEALRKLEQSSKGHRF